MVNFPTLVATYAARIKHAANGGVVRQPSKAADHRQADVLAVVVAWSPDFFVEYM